MRAWAAAGAAGWLAEVLGGRLLLSQASPLECPPHLSACWSRLGLAYLTCVQKMLVEHAAFGHLPDDASQLFRPSHTLGLWRLTSCPALELSTWYSDIPPYVASSCPSELCWAWVLVLG